MNERIVLDHVTMVASDLSASQRFYDAALAPLDISRVFDFPDATGYGGSDGKPDFWIIAGDPVSTGVHIAFVARTRALVETFHHAAVAAGGTSLHTPQEWPAGRALLISRYRASGSCRI